MERKPIALHTKILIGLIVGAVAGVAANALFARPDGVHEHLDKFIQYVADPVGKVFLRLVFMIVVPMVFAALALGVFGLGDMRRLGRVGIVTLLFTLGLSTIAVVLALTLVNVIRPGSGLSPEKQEQLRTQYSGAASALVDSAHAAKSVVQTLVDIIPQNPLQEMVSAFEGGSKTGNGMLSVMFFGLVFGIGLALIPAERSSTFASWLEGLFDVCMVIIGFAMRLAPYAVACLVFAITARLGLEILKTLFWFVVTVLVGLTIHLVVVYSAVVRTFGGMGPLEFFRKSSEAIVTAFATSSSNATLPTALRVARDSLGLPREVSNFVLTVGATGNQNGTALYEGVVVLFLAQVFGVELTFAQQVTVVLMCILAGVGTAGVPGGSLPLIVILLQTVNLPGEGIGIILGADRILDMCRTVLNVTGDLAIATCVSKVETNRAASDEQPEPAAAT